MTHSRKIEQGIVQHLIDCGLPGVVVDHFDNTTSTSGYPQTIVKVDSNRVEDSEPSDHMYESQVSIEYRNDGAAQVDLDDDSAIIEAALSDESALQSAFNYALPYIPAEDNRAVTGVHFHQARGVSSSNEFEGTIAQVDFNTTFVTQAVIDNPL